MGTKLYVGNLPYSITDQQLEELFAKIGKVVSASVITDRYTGRAKGFGFVEMSTAEEAEKATKELNQTEYQGRKLIVSEARPREDRGNRGNRRPGPKRW